MVMIIMFFATGRAEWIILRTSELFKQSKSFVLVSNSSQEIMHCMNLNPTAAVAALLMLSQMLLRPHLAAMPGSLDKIINSKHRRG